MLLGVSPKENIALLGVLPTGNFAVRPMARATIAIMRSPQFEPQWVEIATIDSIGSGNASTPYVDMLRRISIEPVL